MKDDDNEETFSDIIKSWGLIQWIGVACIPLVIGGYFFFPDNTKKQTSETQANISQGKPIQSNSPFIQKDVLYLNHDIKTNRLPQPISFQAIDIDGLNRYQLNLKNNWMIVTNRNGTEAARGQIERFSSPEFNCLGFTQQDAIAVSVDRVKGATETYAICQSLENTVKSTIISTSNAPNPFSIHKDELFFMKTQTAHPIPGYYMRLRLDN